MLSDKVDRIFDKQLAEWPMAGNNYAALKDVKVRSCMVDGIPLHMQFNPARVVSSSAKVDAKSLSERKCFLCAENRPPEQRSIKWGRYSVLVNPYPIFKRHLTVADSVHTPQRIAGRMADMVRLAQELCGYTVFYNGPKCGASAPDHMHFQAGSMDFLVLPSMVLDNKRKTVLEFGGDSLSVVDSLPMRFFVIEADTPEAAEKFFDALYEALPVQPGDDEPMMNILSFDMPHANYVVVVPRKRHRPSFYGTEGDDTMLFSPASVDMGGLFVMPREKDYNRMNRDLARRVYSEVCLSADEINDIVERIKSNHHE
jgi:hypothetical protein